MIWAHDYHIKTYLFKIKMKNFGGISQSEGELLKISVEMRF